MAITGAWSQVSGAVEVPCSMAFDLTFNGLDARFVATFQFAS
jgi:hypothetical protein